MEKMKFTEHINAPKEKVWSTLWEDATYRAWTSAFMEGSHAVTDNWKPGTKVKFLDPKGSGIISLIKENRPYEYMSFEHLGELKNGVEDTTSPESKQWAGAMENYTLNESGNSTDLIVDMQGNISAGFKEYFEKTWPIALGKLKELAEKQ